MTDKLPKISHFEREKRRFDDQKTNAAYEETLDTLHARPRI